MHRTFQRTGLINWMVLLALGAGLEIVSRITGSATAEVGAAFVLVGLFTALVSWFQMRLESAEEAERLELEDLARSRSSAALFDSTAAESFPARKAREQFEKWFIPALTTILFAIEVAAVLYFYRDLKEKSPTAGTASTLGMAMFAAMSLVTFLIGKYTSRLAQLEGVRLLRPGGSALMMGALLALLSAAAEALQWFGFPAYDLHVAWVLSGLLALIAVETLLALVFEAYRPRVRGKEVRLIYESRLVGLLGQPTGLFATAAQALDYQFGFRVSDTWFYRFIEEKIGRFALVWIGILALSDCFVFIEPGEQGLRERFGRPSGEVLGSGVAVKFPRPIDVVHRFPTSEIQGFNVGFVPDEKLEAQRTLLWTKPHYKEEFNLLVASREQFASTNTVESEQSVPVNLLTVSIPVQFLVRDVKAWAYGHSEPKGLLERIANREVVRYMASVDIEKVMSFGRLEAAADLRRNIQKQADTAGLGVEIVFVGLQDIHPPMGSKENQVAASYEKVIGAEQEKESKILEAEGYALEAVPTALANAAKTVNEAKSVAAQKVSEAAGRAAQFTHQLTAYRTAPGLFTTRNYVETFARGAVGNRKLVLLPTNTHDVIILDLSDKIRQDLLDVNIEPVRRDEPKK
jgi:regulator of protease activity HflC (stomatin/prohibitin superfamily)